MTQDIASFDGAISRNPSTGEVMATYPFKAATEVEQVLTENARAAATWRATPMDQRVRLYLKLAATLRDRSNTLARLVTAEMGKTLGSAHAEIEKCALALEWFAEHGPRILDDEPAEAVDADRLYVSFLPIGTVLAIMPWNFPLWQVLRAAAPIMLSGNGFLLKHAANVMGCAFALHDAYEASGFPKGLFANLNVSNQTVDALIADPRIAAVTVTGSMRAGSAVAAAAGRALKKSLLELGGADPYIVLADANIDQAVKIGVEARFQNAGQVCLAAKRFILEQPIADEFTQKYVKAAAMVKAGDPLDPASTIGPIARADLREGVHSQVQRSLAQGAKLLLGGSMIEGPGYFYAPTVLGAVAPGMAAFDEEVFGPVAALSVADDVEHAIALANTSDYGLSGNLWTADLQRAVAIARRLETGGVFINGFSVSNPRLPVGGVKKSGYGRELSHFGLREFVNAQGVWVKTPS